MQQLYLYGVIELQNDTLNTPRASPILCPLSLSLSLSLSLFLPFKVHYSVRILFRCFFFLCGYMCVFHNFCPVMLACDFACVHLCYSSSDVVMWPVVLCFVAFLVLLSVLLTHYTMVTDDRPHPRHKRWEPMRTSKDIVNMSEVFARGLALVRAVVVGLMRPLLLLWCQKCC